MVEYTHPEHGDMEKYHIEQGGIEIDGIRCERCGVVAPCDELDDVFDEHECDRYKRLSNGITGSI